MKKEYRSVLENPREALLVVIYRLTREDDPLNKLAFDELNMTHEELWTNDIIDQAWKILFGRVGTV